MSLDTQSEIEALKRQSFTLLLALIVVSGTLTVYLYRQASIAGKDIDAIKPQAEQLINAFNKNQSLMNNFVKELVDYGQTHPDFRPVLARHGFAAPPAGAPAKPKP